MIPKNIKQFVESGKKTRFTKGFKPWNYGMVKKLICATCKKDFVSKCHAPVKYCSPECRKNGNWGKVVGTWNKGKSSWNKGKPNTWTKQVVFNFCKDCGKEINNYYAKRCPSCHYKTVDYKSRGLKGLLKQQNSKEPTSIEKKVYQELKNRGLLFEKQYLVNGKFLVDAYIPSLNLIIEADGDYWHSLPKTKKKDKAENAYLLKCGYKLMRLSEKEINRKDWSLPIN